MTRPSSRWLLQPRILLAAVAISGAVAVGVIWVRSHRPDPDALTSQAYELIQHGDLDSARLVLAELHQLQPESAEVVEALAEVCILAGDEEAALEWLQSVPLSVPQSATDAAYRGAQLAMQWNRPRDARQCLNHCLQLRPDHSAARRLLMRLELILTRWEAMFAQVTELDQLGQATPADIALYCVGRNFYWEDNSHLEWLKASIEKSPDDCLARTALAYYDRLEGRLARASSLLHDSDFSRSGFESWRRILGGAEVHLDRGNFQRARSELSQLPPAGDANLRTWLAQAQIFTEQGDTASAIVAYNNAALLSPFDPEPVAALSRLLTQQEDHGEAAKWVHRAQLNGELWQILSHAKPLEPQGPAVETVMQMGRVLSELGQHRAAVICFGALTDHFEFGAEARRLVNDTQQSAESQHCLLVASLKDLDRSVSLVGTNRIDVAQSTETGIRSDAAGPSQPLALVDIATDIGLEFTYYQSGSQQDSLAETLGGGIGVVDFDLDEWPDLFLSQSNPLPGDPGSPLSDCLFRSIRGGAAVDATAVASVSHHGYGHGCAVADIDNDGFPDLYVCTRGANVIYRNNGDGTFCDVTREAGLTGVQWSTSASFADYDRDGDLDLYNANYVRIPDGRLGLCRNGNYHGPCRVMDFPAEQDVFLLNMGDGSFQERTDDAGLVAADGKGLGVISSDVDNDGWVDLFVGNDTTGNFLFRNLGEDVTQTEGSAWRGFSETGVLVGVAFNRDGKGEACMGIASEDLNHDGLFDLFISNYEDETNTFYTNLGGLGFEDRTHRVGLAAASRPMLGWGVQFIDLNADRDRDLFVANGHLYDVPMRSQLFLNQSGEFVDVSEQAGPFFQTKKFGRSVAVVDWNRDLAADLAVSFLHSPFALLANRHPIGNRLAVRLIGTQSPREAHGAQLSIKAGGRTTCFQNYSDGGFMAANENGVKIGLGPHKTVETLQVKWPSGAVQVWNGLAAGRKYALVEGHPTPWLMESVEAGDPVHYRTGETN